MNWLKFHERSANSQGLRACSYNEVGHESRNARVDDHLGYGRGPKERDKKNWARDEDAERAPEAEKQDDKQPEASGQVNQFDACRDGGRCHQDTVQHRDAEPNDAAYEN